MDGAQGASWRASRRAVVQLAWPLATVMLGETLMGLVDTKLVGGLGAAALGGVGLANAALYLTNITTLGLMRGVKVCTAHAVGCGHSDQGWRYAQVGLVLGLLVGGLCGVLLSQTAVLMTWMGVRPDLIPQAQSYLSARAYGLPAACALAALMEHRQGAGEMRSSLAVGLGGNVINGVLAYCLIYGHLGMPILGVRGAGIGTTIAEWLQLAAMLWATRPLRSTVARITLSGWTALKELASVGLPTALHFGCEYLAFAAATAVLARLGDVDVAAHQIAVVINRLAYLPGLAIGEVACILVSNALGRRRLEDAELAVRAALFTAIAFMVAVGCALALGGRQLAALFTTDAVIIDLTARVLLIAGAFQVLDATNIVLRGALRGARDVRATAIIGVVVLWLTVPTVTYVVGYVLKQGVVGTWYAFVVETALCVGLFAWRWRQGRWRADYTTTEPAATTGANQQVVSVA